MVEMEACAQIFLLNHPFAIDLFGGFNLPDLCAMLSIVHTKRQCQLTSSDWYVIGSLRLGLWQLAYTLNTNLLIECLGICPLISIIQVDT